MSSLQLKSFALFFLFLGLGWQCGGGDGKDNNGQDSFILPENSDQFSDKNSNDQTATDDRVDVDLAETTSETESGDEANFADLEPPLYDLNGKWYYSYLNTSYSPDCFHATIKQTGNSIKIEECPYDFAKGTLSGEKIEFCTEPHQHIISCHIGQVISPTHIEGKNYLFWDYGAEAEGENWYMDKED